jgi:S-DNA-T family DNA segregation ATPase FtsK/SpoIIIE
MMAKPKPVGPVQPPFIQAFPRLSLAIRLTAATLRLFAAGVRRLWPWRRELAAVLVLNLVWRLVDQITPTWLALTAYLVLLGGVSTWRRSRRLALGWLRCSRTRRQVLAGLAETRAANPSGKLPKVVSMRVTPVGERLIVHARPGQSAELLDARVEELRAAARCREVRVARDEHRSHRVTFDIVRTDPLAASADVVWADLHASVLSMWDPVAMGVDEYGNVVRLSLRERGILFAGEPGSGKSNQQTIIIGHAWKSPDAQLVLIDPNEVQFAPWRHGALAFATDDPADALDAVDLVRDEVRRRLALLRSLPGVVRKVTPQICAEHDLPLLLLFIDELAFHTSVAGTPAQRNAFATATRDVVARSRAAGIIPVFGTQRPTSDVVPTSLRDLFSVRCAFRTTTKASSDVILGEGWARQGYSATDIDINARGVGWLLAEGQQPKRFKGAWLPDDGIADLSVTTVMNRPATGPSVPAPRPVAGVA